MLSEAQKDRVWEGLYLCEVRHLHYAHLSRRFQSWQTFLTWTMLVSSSGTFAALVTVVAVVHPMVPRLLAIAATGVSFYSLLARKERKAIDSSRLSVDYALLAQKYETLYDNMASATPKKLGELDDKRIGFLERAQALGYSKKLMLRAQKQVEMERGL